jgi:hypothetical protein
MPGSLVAEAAAPRPAAPEMPEPFPGAPEDQPAPEAHA